MTKKEENDRIHCDAIDGFKKVARASLIEEPFEEQQKAIVSLAKLTLGLVTFENKAKLQKDWADIDWSAGTPDLADCVFSSGKEEIFSACPLPWTEIVLTPENKDDNVFFRRREDQERMWFVENVVKSFPKMWGDFRTNTRVSSLPSQLGDAFRKYCLDNNIVNADTLFKSNAFWEVKPWRLYELSVLYGNSDFLGNIPLDKGVYNKDTAEATLYCVFNCIYFPNEKNKNLPTFNQILTQCLKFSPSLARKFPRYFDNQSLYTNEFEESFMGCYIEQMLRRKIPSLRNYAVKWIKKATNEERQEFVDEMSRYSCEQLKNALSVLKSLTVSEQTSLVKNILRFSFDDNNEDTIIVLSSLDKVKNTLGRDDLLKMCDNFEKFIGNVRDYSLNHYEFMPEGSDLKSVCGELFNEECKHLAERCFKLFSEQRRSGTGLELEILKSDLKNPVPRLEKNALKM